MNHIIILLVASIAIFNSIEASNSNGKLSYFFDMMNQNSNEQQENSNNRIKGKEYIQYENQVLPPDYYYLDPSSYDTSKSNNNNNEIPPPARTTESTTKASTSEELTLEKRYRYKPIIGSVNNCLRMIIEKNKKMPYRDCIVNALMFSSYKGIRGKR